MDLFLQSVQEGSFMNELKYLFEIPAPGSVLQLLFETASLSSKCVFGVTVFKHNSRHQRPATVAGCFKYTYCVGNIWGWETNTKLNIAPENGWLEDDPFLLGFGLCSWGELAVSFREIAEDQYCLCGTWLGRFGIVASRDFSSVWMMVFSLIHVSFGRVKEGRILVIMYGCR